jgi:hypothetical protein
MTYLNISIDRDTKEKLRLLARRDKRSLGAEAFYLIERGMASMDTEAIQQGKTQIDMEALNAGTA